MNELIALAPLAVTFAIMFAITANPPRYNE